MVGMGGSAGGLPALLAVLENLDSDAALAVVEFGLILKTTKKGPEPLPEPGAPDARTQAVEDTPTTVY